jgi:outer membrane protein assembly factor BamB
MDRITFLLLAGLFLGLFGIYLGWTGIAALARGGRSAANGFRILLAVVAIGAAAWVGWRYQAGIHRLFQSDYQADEARLDELKKARLDRLPERPGEWPQWRGPNRDGLSAETGLLSRWPEKGPRVLWRTPIKGGYASPVVANGRVYVFDRDGSQERLVCLDAASGKEQWTYRYDFDAGKISGFNSYGAGPRATPTIHDGRVYTVGATGLMHCLEAEPAGATPKVFWQHDLLAEFRAPMPQWGIACSPLVEDNLVIVQPGGSDASIVAFDRLSGEVVWKALSDNAGYSSPVAATAAGVRQVICFTGKGLAGLRAADGEQLWYFPWSTPYDCNVATPIVAGDYVFISSDYSTGCALLHLVPEGEGVKVERIWVRSNKLMRNQFSTCVLLNGHLYGFDVVGHGGTGTLKCADLRTAQEKWAASRELPKGCLLAADGHLLVLGENGELALVEATPDEFRLKGRVQVLNGSECWAPPALAGGRLYLRDHREIVCLDLKK